MVPDKAMVDSARAIAEARREAARESAKVRAQDLRQKEFKKARAVVRLEEEDPKRLTRWLPFSESEASCHAGGGPLAGSEWLRKECAAHRAKGKMVCIREHPAKPHLAALFLE